MFNARFNNLINIPKAAEFIAYADNPSVFVSGTSINTITEDSNKTLGRLRAWAKNNFLK